MSQEGQPRSYTRFSAAQRFEHMVLTVTFIGLALTGLPQRYADQQWAQQFIAAMGGIETIRIIHRVMATVLLAECIYHGGIISYKLFVLGRRATMLPALKDAWDALHWIMFNLGLRREHPHMPRYNFGEKAEYLALVWGTIVMAITGFMMWNPITTTKVLPGEVIPAARAAHSAEALLAVLSIIIWHFYNVLIRTVNPSIFTGEMSHEMMEEEHASELDAIEHGKISPMPPTDVIARRNRFFVPYAVIVTLVLTVGLFFFITYEDTAITTLPAQRTSRNIVVSIDPNIGTVEQGAQVWEQAECGECHGDAAQGGNFLVGVPLAGQGLTLEYLVTTVRRGPADMPAYPPSQVSDDQLAHLWAWLLSLDAS